MQTTAENRERVHPEKLPSDLAAPDRGAHCHLISGYVIDPLVVLLGASVDQVVAAPRTEEAPTLRQVQPSA